MPLKNDLQKVIQGEIVNDLQTLTTYSKDASIFEISPDRKSTRLNSSHRL